jgi:hypothetical protein
VRTRYAEASEDPKLGTLYVSKATLADFENPDSVPAPFEARVTSLARSGRPVPRRERRRH